MSQTVPPANITPIRPAVAPQSWPGPYSPGPYPACPPDAFSAMARLVSCYEDVRLATEFLSKVMKDIIANDPTVTTAIIDAIQAAGSNIPLIGVTNGSNAQPGQVGEYVEFSQSFAYATTITQGTLTMGVLQPGDWDISAWAVTSAFISDANLFINPVPAGVNSTLQMKAYDGGNSENVSLQAATGRASVSTPSVFAYSYGINVVGDSPSAGTIAVYLGARRAR